MVQWEEGTNDDQGPGILRDKMSPRSLIPLIPSPSPPKKNLMELKPINPLVGKHDFSKSRTRQRARDSRGIRDGRHRPKSHRRSKEKKDFFQNFDDGDGVARSYEIIMNGAHSID